MGEKDNKRHFKTYYDSILGDSFINFRDEMLNKSENPEDLQLWDEQVRDIYKNDFDKAKGFFRKIFNK